MQYVLLIASNRHRTSQLHPVGCCCFLRGWKKNNEQTDGCMCHSVVWITQWITLQMRIMTWPLNHVLSILHQFGLVLCWFSHRHCHVACIQTLSKCSNQCHLIFFIDSIIWKKNPSMRKVNHNSATNQSWKPKRILCYRPKRKKNQIMKNKFIIAQHWLITFSVNTQLM